MAAKPIAGDASVLQGSIEGANEDAIHGTMQLVLVQRQAEMMQKALSVFNNDFDKTAAEELAAGLTWIVDTGVAMTDFARKRN